ncbi:hypothetical protein ONZ51_g10619 [Trametes cubensis]|uniref:Zn(2)-C6 fungal-type domain-containing protein n=1 Tax=Trametes cubensis TaxID=1111947 RepID=A0AAD7TLR2_9APHY|nr:hypothetical protein ONZ51_g10619 [Trametes cubensis]
MSSIEFVIEAPQSSQQNKKRPRLVTSCDHCRVKKIKCIQQPSAGACEACSAANLPCLYRDREQYFAERARTLSGLPSAVCDASSVEQTGVQLSVINAAVPSGSHGMPKVDAPTPISPARTFNLGYYPYVDMGALDFGPFQDLLGSLGVHGTQTSLEDPLRSLAWCPPRNSAMGYGLPLSPPTPPSPLLPPPSSGLFDPIDPAQPHPKLMMDFIHVFFENLGTTYTFLCPAAICQDFLNHRLSPLLANALAAAAADYSTVPEVHHIGAANVTDVYCQVAKYLIPLGGPQPSLENLHALMVLAWVEYKRGQHLVFEAYARTSIQLAANLDISPSDLPRLTQSIDDRMTCLLKATLENIQLMGRMLAASESALRDNAVWHG